MLRFYRYKEFIIWVILIIGALFFSTCFYGELHPVIAAIGGLLFSIPIKHFWQSYMKPVIGIKKEIEPRSFHPFGGGSTLEYICNRIIVENTGRTAAKNCKGYIVTDTGKERICWTVPAERPDATINAKDEERLDFCAFLNPESYKAGVATEAPPKIIRPTEEGWEGLLRNLSELMECEVLITAENADPVSKKIRFNLDTGEIEWV